MTQTITAVISAITTSTVLTPILALILQKWVGARIEKSIEHAYDVKLERIREDIAVKNRAALVAELLSEWLNRPKDSTRLNRLTFGGVPLAPQRHRRGPQSTPCQRRGRPGCPNPSRPGA